MSAQKPPSHITELENLVSNLRRDLQVAHDALHKAHERLEQAEGLLRFAMPPSRSNSMIKVDDWIAMRDAWLKEGK